MKPSPDPSLFTAHSFSSINFSLNFRLMRSNYGALDTDSTLCIIAFWKSKVFFAGLKTSQTHVFFLKFCSNGRFIAEAVYRYSINRIYRFSICKPCAMYIAWRLTVGHRMYFEIKRRKNKPVDLIHDFNNCDFFSSLVQLEPFTFHSLLYFLPIIFTNVFLYPNNR